MGTTPGYVRPDWLDSEEYIFITDRDSLPLGGTEASWTDVPPQAIGDDSEGDGSNYFICTYYDDGGGRPLDRFAYHYASWRAPSLTVPGAHDSDTTEGYSIVRTLPGQQTYANYQCEGDFQSWLHGSGAWLDPGLGPHRGFRAGSQFYVPLIGHVTKPGAPGPDYVPEYWTSSAAQEIFVRNPDAPPAPPEPPPPPVVGECPRPDWPYRDSHVAAGGGDAAVWRYARR